MQTVVATDPRFWNQIGPFGGWLAAEALRAMRTEIGTAAQAAALVPRAIHVLFMGRLAAGEFGIEASVLRRQRTAAFARAQLWQDGRLAVTADALFGQGREGSQHAWQRGPDLPPPDTLPDWRALEPLARFTREFDYRVVRGQPGGGETGEGRQDSAGYVRLRANRAPSAEDMLLLADAWFPASWSGLRRTAPVSTLSMHVMFHHPWQPAAAYPHDFLAAHHASAGIDQGYADERGELWLPDGRLALLCQQQTWIDTGRMQERSAALAKGARRRS